MGLTHAQMLMMQGVNNDSEDDGLGDVASPEQLGQIGGRKNKIVVGKKGKKKKVINNFMADKWMKNDEIFLKILPFHR